MSSLDRASWSLNSPDFTGWDFNEHVATRAQYVWDTGSLAWVKMTQPGGSGSGGTQYTDGATSATPTGTVALGKNNSNLLHALSLDGSGNLNVNLAAGSISGGNAAASPIGSAVPASADYLGYNLGGNLVGVSDTNRLPSASTIVDIGGQVNTLKTLGTQVVSADIGLVTNSVIHGLTTGGGGGYVDVKVNPSGALTADASNSTNIGVTGTFWQATQPVSWAGQSVSITGSVAVTGTFWQATQPVSIASMPSTPVTGTFWQATQPVSAASLPLPSGASTETTLAKVPGLSIPIHDFIALTQNSTQDIYTFKTGGSGGTLVATVTVTFTDSTKATLSTVAKT